LRVEDADNEVHVISLSVYRVLLRRHHSAQDLTHSLKVHMEREAKKQAKVDAMFNEVITSY